MEGENERLKVVIKQKDEEIKDNKKVSKQYVSVHAITPDRNKKRGNIYVSLCQFFLSVCVFVNMELILSVDCCDVASFLSFHVMLVFNIFEHMKLTWPNVDIA